MEWIIIGLLALTAPITAPLGATQVQYALPPQPYIDPWGRAHWVWYDPYGFPHVSEPVPPPLVPAAPPRLPPHAPLPPIPSPPNLTRSACYDENWRFTGEDNPACEGPMLTK